MSTEQSGTRERLIVAAMELVAARGYDGATVGEIEHRAGLAPRSGALYKYFGSKLEVVEAGLEAHLASIDSIEVDLSELPVGDPAVEAELLARWLLGELDRERVLTHVIEREGERLGAVRERMREQISDRGYRAAAQFSSRWGRQVDFPTDDIEALAVLLVGSLINFRRSTWTFDREPLGLDDERIIDAFVKTITAILNRHPEQG